MSLTCTPRARHWERSMSRYSQGVSTREPLNTPCNSRVWLPSRTDPVADPLQFLQAEVAAILDDDFEAAGGAQALDRWGAERLHDRPPHRSATTAPRWRRRWRRPSGPGCAARRTASAGRTWSPGWARWRSGSAIGRRRRPCARPPACPRAICSMRAMRRSVRSTEAASGNCTLRSRYPLSCSGMKPVGTVANCQPVSASRPPYSSRTIRLTRRTPLTVAP